MTTSALKLPWPAVDSDEFVASRESKAVFGADRSVLRTSVVVVMEIRSGLVRKLTVGSVVEPLERRPTVPRDLMSLEVCLKATSSRIIVGTIDFSNENEKYERGNDRTTHGKLGDGVIDDVERV